MPSEWREVLGRRNRTSKTKRLYEDDRPTQKYSWDGMVGTSLHYEEAGEWLEVDPRIVPSSEPGWDWEMQKSHWRFLVRNGGWFAAEKQGVGIGFKLERVAYLNIQTKDWQTIRAANYSTPTVEAVPRDNDLLPNPKGKLTWANLFPGVDFEIHVSGDGIHEEIKVSQAARDAMPAPPYPAADTYLVMVYKVDWGQVPGLADDDGDIDYDTDFERQGRLYLKNHLGEIITVLPASRAWPEGEPEDAEGEPIEVPLRKRFVKLGAQHYLLVGAPVLALNALPQGTIIFDPDLYPGLVTAGTDDGDTVPELSEIFKTTTAPYLGYYSAVPFTHNHWARWDGVAIEGTITTSYVELYCHAGPVTLNLKVHGVDEDDPAAPTTYAEYAADPLTAGLDWDEEFVANNWIQSPSLNAIFQALVDAYTITNHAVMIQIKNDGTTTTTVRHYEYSGNAHGPRLHIEYTVGGVDVTVDAVLATATAAGLIAVVTGGTGATVSGELATAAAEGLVSVVSGGTGATVTAVLAEAVAAALLPTITGDALVTSVLAEAVAAGLVPAVTGGTGTTVSAVLAEAVAAALLPTITGDGLVSAVLATAAAAALLPTITGDALVSGELATAMAAALVPAITGETGATVSAELAEAIAAALVPIVTGGTGATVSAAVATAIAEALAPRILTLWIALTLQTRSTDLTLDSRSLDLTLRSRTLDLTLQTRSLDLTLPTRSLDLTLRERDD